MGEPLRQTLHLDGPGGVNLISLSEVHTQNQTYSLPYRDIKGTESVHAHVFPPEELCLLTGKAYI